MVSGMKAKLKAIGKTEKVGAIPTARVVVSHESDGTETRILAHLTVEDVFGLPHVAAILTLSKDEARDLAGRLLRLAETEAAEPGKPTVTAVLDELDREGYRS